jgi:hypothetical protein
MANSDRPRGAEVYGRVKQANKYKAGGAIYPGDFVHLEADGKVDAAAAGESLIGVALSYASADGEDVIVSDHPDQRYVVQGNEDDIDAQTDIGLNYNIVATAGDTSYKISRHELDTTSGDTTSTLPLKLVDVVDSPVNALGEFVDCVVKINNHILGNVTESAG